jgi:hypothetical protein
VRSISHLYSPSEWQKEFHALRTNYALGAGSAGVGKALAVTTMVPTPGGWRTMGDIAPGDVVFSELGAPCTVLGVSPVMVNRDCFEVVFDDGSVVVADGEHLWQTMDYNERARMLREERSGRPVTRSAVKTTLQIASTLKHNGRTSHAVLNAEPFDVPDATLPMPPYLMGLWLGDGTKSTAGFAITKPDQEVADAVAAFASSLGCTVTVSHGSSGCPTMHVVNRMGARNPATSIIRDLFPRLADGDYGVPPAFAFASRAQRRELLDGLVDSDGYVAPNGHVEICFCHERLASEVVSLIASLGFKPTLRTSDAKLYGRVVGKRYRIHFCNMGEKLGRIPRKRDAGSSQARTSRWRYVEAVRPVESVPVKCLLVDNPTHLFVVGERFIPTHNTLCLVMDILELIITEHERCLLPRTHPHHLKWGRSTCNTLYLRRELTQLEQTIDRYVKPIFSELDPDAPGWHPKTNTFEFSSGLKSHYGHCKDSNDHLKYLSNEYQWVGFDEWNSFEKKQNDGICSRVRSSDIVLRKMLKVRGMSNPGPSPGEDAHWLRKMFVDPHPAGRMVLTKNLRMKDGTPFERTYLYLPGRLSDNPNREFAVQYEQSLLDLPEHIRRAYLDGDWYFTPGSFFGNDWDPRIHVVPPFRVPRDWPKFRSMDWGFKSPGCVCWWAIDDDGNLVCFDEFYFKEMHDRDVAERIKQIELRLGLWDSIANESRISGPADTQLWEERGESAMRKIDVFYEAGVPWEQADKSPGSRKHHAQRMLKRLKSHHGRSQLPGIMFMENCRNCIRTIPQLPTDEVNPEEWKKGGDDHCGDAVAYGVAYASGGAAGIVTRQAPEESDEWDQWSKRDQPEAPAGRWGLNSGYR